MKKLIKSLLIISIILIPAFGNIYAEDSTPPPECTLPQILVENVCTDPTPILGCINNGATNFNPNATTDDGSCIYPTPSTPDPVTIHLTIKNNTGNLYNQNLTVNACDSDNPNSGNLKVTAYCAVLQSELSTDWNFAWAPGIFLNSINGISGFITQDKDGLDVYHYWSWGVNDTEAMVGLNQYDLKTDDQIYLTFVDPQTEPEVVEQVSHFHSPSGSYTSSKVQIKKVTFDTKKAFEFLVSQQKENGSFGEELYTDWVAITLSSTDQYQEQKTKLTKYYLTNKFSGKNLTDYERHAIALMSLGLNPYNVNGENYIKKITDTFDGEQFGDKNTDNDDIFALIVLQNVGYTEKDKMISDTISFILNKQNTNGSWDNSVDLTGASIEALSAFQNDLKVKTALENAKKYLKNKQQNDGGFSNVSSTAWAMQGILGLSEKILDWKNNENTPLDYLALNQDTDGGIKNEDLNNRIWQTSYVLTSLSEKTWNTIMQKFEQPIIQETNKKEEVVKKISTANKIPKQKTKKEILNTENQAASAINAVADAQNKPTQNWFKKIIGKIFGF